MCQNYGLKIDKKEELEDKLSCRGVSLGNVRKLRQIATRRGAVRCQIFPKFVQKNFISKFDDFSQI